MRDTKSNSTTAGTPAVLTETELSERWKMSIRTLQFWRYRKTGPKYIKIHGRAVRYPMDAILAYEAEAGIEPLDALKGNGHEHLATDYPQRSVIESSV